MARILLIFLCLLAGLLVYRTLVARRRDNPPDTPKNVQQPMVRCAQCGVFVPDAEALSEGTERFCSEAHRQAQSRK